MIMKPWEMGPEAWDYIQEFPVDQQAAVTITYQHFNYNSYKVPCVAAYVVLLSPHPSVLARADLYPLPFADLSCTACS